jgi:uncharacterized membrane protein YbhN (UPF0104 family)
MPSWLRTTLKLIFTGVILGILVRIAGARDILSAFDSLAWHAVAAMIICALIRRFVISTQLWLILRQSGLSVSVFRVFLANALAALYSIFLPGNIASAGVKWLDLSAATGKKAAVFNGLIYHRMVMTLLTLAIGGAALTISNPLSYRSLTYLPAGFLIILSIGFVCVYHPRVGTHLERMLRKLSQRFPVRLSGYAGSIIDALGRFRRFSVYDHIRIFAWASLSVALRILVLFFAIQAMAIDVSLVHVLWISAFLVFTAALPLTIANLGVREGLLIVALSPFDVAPALAIALGLLLFSNQIVAALIGVAYQIALNFGWVRWQVEATHGTAQ